jgi:hypothetical protein
MANGEYGKVDVAPASVKAANIGWPKPQLRPLNEEASRIIIGHGEVGSNKSI